MISYKYNYSIPCNNFLNNDFCINWDFNTNTIPRGFQILFKLLFQKHELIWHWCLVMFWLQQTTLVCLGGLKKNSAVLGPFWGHHCWMVYGYFVWISYYDWYNQPKNGVVKQKQRFWQPCDPQPFFYPLCRWS